MKSIKAHWNEIFAEADDHLLGWYEKDAIQSFKLINKVPEWQKSAIFLVGAGTTTLAGNLLENGAKLIINDISSEALEKLKSFLGAIRSSDITWLCQDIARPIRQVLPEIGIWFDRAVLHFLNDGREINGYFENVRWLLKPGSYAIFAEFSESGAQKCAGLPVHRYSVEELSERLGNTFMLIEESDHVFINPYGDSRPYIYALYEKL